MLRRIRRLADVSQHELARACGVSQSAVAQADTGRRDLAVETLATAAALAGLRLTLLDTVGTDVLPMSPDTVRDGGDHRFPADLDTRRPDEGHGLYEPRRDRPEPSYTVTRDRAHRDVGRDRGAGELAHLPDPFLCTCPEACEELDDRSGKPVHAEGCPCLRDVA